MKLRAGIIALALKLGPKMLGLLGKMAKTLKVGKVGLAAASAGSYAYLFSWKFAALIMLTLFVHESGHIWAMKWYGMKVKGIYFLPFFGGAAVSEDRCPSREAEVVVALMGPFWGLVLSMITALVGMAGDMPMLTASAVWMALVNLFNLLPIIPLDGGRVMEGLFFSISNILGVLFFVVSCLIAGIALIYLKLWIFALLLPIGLLEFFAKWLTRKTIIPELSLVGIVLGLLGYIVVGGLLFYTMIVCQSPDTEVALKLLM